MEVPYLDLAAQYRSIKREIDDAIQQVIERSDFTTGQAVVGFEAAFAEYCGVRHCVGTNNGTNALLLALNACDIGHGDEVITAANTFVATVEAIVHVGARPVLVDVEPTTRTIDPQRIPAAMSDKTRALIPVHLYGRCASMYPVIELAGEHNLVVIEDAAQAHGASYHGQKAGSLGRAAAFSFYPSKNLGAFGEAGAVTTNDSGLADKIRMLRDHGSGDKRVHHLIGYNARIEGLQAAVLTVKLKHLDDWNDARQQIAGWYRSRLHGLPLRLPADDDNSRQVYHLFVIETEHRDRLREHLKFHGVSTMIHYPTPIHLQPAYEYLGYRTGDFPITERLSQQILSLPIYPELTEEQVAHVCDGIRSFFDDHP